MFDIAWSEMAIIAVVAIVVIGPKDLPKVMRAVGQFTAKARSMAREFQSGLEELARETEVDQVKGDLAKLAQFDIENEIGKSVDPGGEIQKSLGEVGDAARALDVPAVEATKPETAKPGPQESHER